MRNSRAESIMSVNDIAIQSQPLLNVKDSNKVGFGGYFFSVMVVFTQADMLNIALLFFFCRKIERGLLSAVSNLKRYDWSKFRILRFVGIYIHEEFK